MIKILLSGCNGRMGRVISEICKSREDISIVCGFDMNTAQNYDYPVYSELSMVSENPDIVIDFSNPGALAPLLYYCLKENLPLVLATTGYNGGDIEKINEAARSIPLFRSGNMSLGINTLIMLTKKAAKVLGESFDIEIIEQHHNQKLDAPSGTALMISDAVQESLNFDTELIYDRHDKSEKRAKSQIGMHCIRGGTIVGVHEVVFAGFNEILEIKHTAQSREIFASGAVSAAIFLAAQKSPGHYNMYHLLANFI